MILLSALIVAGAIVWAGLQIIGEMRAARRTGTTERLATLLTLFAPGLTATQQDPRAFLVWQPIAQAARQLFPEEFASPSGKSDDRELSSNRAVSQVLAPSTKLRAYTRFSVRVLRSI